MGSTDKGLWLLTSWCILHIASSGKVAGLPCPKICECYFTNNAILNADCSKRQLGIFPEGIDAQTQILDLSKNDFDHFPMDVSSVTYLEKLDLSQNHIKMLAPTILTNMTYLTTLDLSKNEIQSWTDINPNYLLLPAESLDKLILSGNRLAKFSNLKTAEYLLSKSIQTLELSDCGITSIHGRSPVSGLTDLRRLVLSFNPLKKIQQLISPTLEYLDLSHCELTSIGSEDFNYLPILNHLILSHNYRLEVSSNIGILSSLSVHTIDLSYCNMNQVNLSGLPNLKVANLQGNMIQALDSGYFRNNTKLTTLDLSSNSIKYIHQSSFQGMLSLKSLNLSVNLIPSLNSETFSYVPNLTTLELSRNYISYLGSFTSHSLQNLDLSMCEIQVLGNNIFDRLPSILVINLSRNLISSLPNNMKSDSLQYFDLSFNRLSSLNNSTFFKFPELRTLHLSENRFTNTWKVSYFANNHKLLEISMRDNTWRCDCFENDMKDLFAYLTYDPPKVWSTDSLICFSPYNVSDRTWLDACFNVWNPPSALGENKRALSFMFVIFCSLFGVFIVVSLVRRVKQAKMRAAQIERERTAAETRERVREERMRREQEAQINAPDPRDLISPPSYDEALLMPRLDGSFHSLSGVGVSQTKKKKKARRRTRSSGDILEEVNADENRRHRRRRRSRVSEASPTVEADMSSVRFINGSDGHINIRNGQMHESDL